MSTALLAAVQTSKYQLFKLRVLDAIPVRKDAARIYLGMGCLLPPRLSVVTIGLMASLGAACSNPASPDVVVEPIQIDRVDVRILESSPPLATAHVEGVVGDGCATLHSVQQSRSGNTVTVTILRRRPAVAVCIQIAILYNADIPLTGQYPPGTYVLRVNTVERTFTTE